MQDVKGLRIQKKANGADNHSSFYQIVEYGELMGKSGCDRYLMVEHRNYKLLWTYAANCILGFLLITNPFLFNYKSDTMSLSDMVSGALIIAFEFISFAPRYSVLRFGTCIVAFWLLLAPLIFWSPTPAGYLVDTLCAALILTFAIVIPGMPTRGDLTFTGPDQPPEWTYNPSSFIRRWLGIALALVGFAISRYLAAHQLGYISHVWDPFFGEGSNQVLSSSVSRSFPVSDAGLGSIAYLMEALAGFAGDRARWRTAPWTVFIFAMLVVPLGVTSVVLVITQPIFVGAWCGWCLIAAAGLLLSVPLAVHEIIAVGQFLLAAVEQRKNVWRLFWFGGTIIGAGRKDPDRMQYTIAQRWLASVQGVTVPKTILLQVAIGLWLMARPDLLPASHAAANCDHLLGAMIVTVAAIATAEVTRISRFLNIPLGIAVSAAAILFGGAQPLVLCTDLVAGFLLLLAAIPCAEIFESYGSWNRFVR